MPGSYCVLQTDDRRIDLTVAGPVVSLVLGIPAVDAGRALVESSGIIWQDLDQETAERLAAGLTASGIGAVAQAWSSLRMPGPTYVIFRGQFRDNALHVLGKGFEREIAFPDLALLTCARVKGDFQTDRINTGGAPASSGYGPHRVRQATASIQTFQKRQTPKTYLCLFARDPEEVFQLESQSFKYAGLGIPMGFSTFENFGNLARELTRRAPEVTTNLGVDILLHGSGDWGEVTFDSPEEFERHNIWMRQLAP